MTAPINGLALLALLGSWVRPAAAAAEPGDGTTGLASLSPSSFRWMMMEAMSRARPVTPAEAPLEAAGPPPAPRPAAAPETPGALPRDAAPRAGLAPSEAEVIAREAQRAGIDPNLLAALRRAENGRPGREFGVISMSATGLERQARVAANTIRNMAIRFERRGRAAVDPVTGRYTEAFLRFFSARYAPRGAENDPGDMNRFHAANLIALYRRSRGVQA